MVTGSQKIHQFLLLTFTYIKLYASRWALRAGKQSLCVTVLLSFFNQTASYRQCSVQLSNLSKIWLKKLCSGKIFVTISEGHRGIFCITLGPLPPNSAGQAAPTFSSSNYFCVFGCRKSMLFTVEEMSMTHLLFPYQTIIEFFHSTFLARQTFFLMFRSFQPYGRAISREIQHQFLTNPARLW